ncbi:winged helix-turn-helix domain-containing tetratricopeptide repeat protein [Rubellimicrobium arenae]|uniref:winged helix-turn-helix domain-containing tetratricopeptide repeat protein n=1 Tax=Rubellimicrobium arenae TaxID=2817372 RepID=UPI001B30D05C|nr:winged helix-turn-helix domain-containing protein [Rubellimicrobium arenae]
MMTTAPPGPVYQFDGYTLDLGAGTLRHADQEIALRPKTYAVLTHLVSNAGRIIGRDELLDTVWADVTVTEDSLTQCISELRRALGDDGGGLLRTVPRRGYLFSGHIVRGPATVAASGPERSDKPAIAVLAFEDLSRDHDQDYFATGLTEDIIRALSLVREIFIVSRAATAVYRGRTIPPRQMAEELGVRYLLEGSVRVAGEQMRVTAQLVDSVTGSLIWSERFEGTREDVFAFQDRITRQVAVALQIKLTYGELARLWDGQTRDLAAWEKMVVARDLFLRFNEGDNLRARLLLREALDIDPGYVTAMVLLGLTHWCDARFYLSADPELALLQAEEQAQRALAANFGVAGGHMLAGLVAFLRDRHEEAVAQCRRSCDLAPGNSWNYAVLGLVQIYGDDPHGALVAFDTAFSLSPRPPNWYLYNLALANHWAGRPGAAEQARRYRDAEPSDPYGYANLAMILALQGYEAEAAREVASLRRLFPSFGMEQIRRSQRYKDARKLELAVASLRKAGLPEQGEARGAMTNVSDYRAK